MQLLLAESTEPSRTVVETFFGSTAGEFTLLGLLIGIALALLPREHRRDMLQPIVFLFLAIVSFTLSMLFSNLGMTGVFRFAGEFLLFAAVGRICFLLIVTAMRKVSGWSPQKIYLDIVMGAIYVMVLLPALGRAGLKTSELVTGTTVFSAVLGLALQGTLGNIFAGIAIHIHHPFSVGDWIQFDDKREHIGKVKEISWRATTVVTLDAIEVVIPNSKLAEVPLTNFMRPGGFSRRSIYFVCPYAIPPARVHAIVLKAISGSLGVLESPAPTIVTNLFTERGVEYWLRFFTDQLDTRDGVDGGVRDRIWYALDREGVAMPPATHQVQLTAATAETKQTEIRDRIALHEKLLRATALCQGLSDSAFNILATESRICRYLPNEVVIRQGEPGDQLFIVNAGRVGVSASKSGAAPVEVAQLGVGDYFGEMSLLLGEPRSSTVTAATQSELLVIGRHAFATAFAESPETVETVSETIASRRTELDARLAEEKSSKAEVDKAKSVMVGIKKYFGIA